MASYPTKTGVETVDLNPYTSPSAEALRPKRSEYSTAGIGIWRQEGRVVFHFRVVFPPVCLKSNQATLESLARRLSYRHSLSLIPCVVTVRIPFSNECLHHRRIRLIASWIVALVAIATVPLLALATGSHWIARKDVSYSASIVLVAAFAGAWYGWESCRLVRASRIEGDYIWLEGACSEYLAALPNWPFSQ